MYPHERSLVKSLKDEPFALLGVNADPDLEKANAAIEKNEINWRSFWDGPKGPGGPIAQSWNVQGWPTVFLMDAEGRIRHKNLRGEKELDEAIAKLIAEAKKPAAAGGGQR